MIQLVIPFLLQVMGPAFCLSIFAFLDSPNSTKYNIFKFYTIWIKVKFFSKEFSKKLMPSFELIGDILPGMLSIKHGDTASFWNN